MNTSRFEYTWEEVYDGAVRYDLELELLVGWTPFIPAKIHGLPEDCHPAEGGETELHAIRVVQIMRTDPGSEPREMRVGKHVSDYWTKRFEKEVEPTDAFKEWMNDMVASDEAQGPDEDDYRDDDR